jgi:hypothetical protein
MRSSAIRGVTSSASEADDSDDNTPEEGYSIVATGRDSRLWEKFTAVRGSQIFCTFVEDSGKICDYVAKKVNRLDLTRTVVFV